MRFGIAVFPGTWSDRDCKHALELAGHEAVMLWHKDRDLQSADCVILPGGFSYGDYLRAGAVARFAPLMESVIEFANAGGLVWGICNGFQILCEAHLLPGALTRNSSLEFRCAPTWLRVETVDSAFTAGCAARTTSCRFRCRTVKADTSRIRTTLETLEREDRVAFRYVRRDGSAVEGDIAERIDARHRGHRQRASQCARDDAASGARVRAAARFVGWDAICSRSVAKSVSGNGAMPVAAVS